MLKMHIYLDKDPSDISSPPDNESCEIAVRLLTGIKIYTIESSKSPIFQVQSVCAIFGLDYNMFYIETEVYSFNSSQSESGFGKTTLSGGVFKRQELFLALDIFGEFNFDAKNPYLSRERFFGNFVTAKQ